MERYSVTLPKEIADNVIGLTEFGMSFLANSGERISDRSSRIVIPAISDIREPFVDLVFSHLETALQSSNPSFIQIYSDIYYGPTGERIGMAIIVTDAIHGFYRHPNSSETTLITNKVVYGIREQPKPTTSESREPTTVQFSEGLANWSWLGIGVIMQPNIYGHPWIYTDVRSAQFPLAHNLTNKVKEYVTTDSLSDWLMIVPQPIFIQRILENIDRLNMDILKRFFYQTYNPALDFRLPEHYIAEDATHEDSWETYLTLALVTRVEAETLYRTHDRLHDLLSILRRKVDVLNTIQAIDMDVTNLKQTIKYEENRGTAMYDRHYCNRMTQLATVDVSRLTAKVYTALEAQNEMVDEINLESVYHPKVSFGAGRFYARVVDNPLC